MPTYQCIVCAIDLTDEAELVIHRAMQLVRQSTDRIHLIHACEHPITGYGELTGSHYLVTETRIRQSVSPRMETFSTNNRIPREQCHIEFGRPADVIYNLADTLQADLIVIGSHGRSGIRLLLGSTANSVLHGASCDVLTVRIKQE